MTRWQETYDQQAWLRQLSPQVGPDQEDAVMRCIARLDGVSFPSTGRLAWRWLTGRDHHLSRRDLDLKAMRPEVAYCAEVVALTYEEMGLLTPDAPMNWYDPGRFWSGDSLPLVPGWDLGREVAVGRGPSSGSHEIG